MNRRLELKTKEIEAKRNIILCHKESYPTSTKFQILIAVSLIAAVGAVFFLVTNNKRLQTRLFGSTVERIRVTLVAVNLIGFIVAITNAIASTPAINAAAIRAGVFAGVTSRAV